MTEIVPRVSSSSPHVLPLEQERIFRDALCLLNKHKVPYVVTGAFALAQHTGIWHPTKDLDLALTHAHTSDAIQALQEGGFICEVRDPVWLAKAHRDDFFVDLIFGMSNGVIVVKDSWIERSHPGSVVGIPTRVMAPEELLASKLFVARRDRFDGSDVAHIFFRAGRSLDWERVLDLVGEHWQLLLSQLIFFTYIYPTHVALIPEKVWKDLLARFQECFSSPGKRSLFRGTLIDPDLFAIDVNEWGFEDELPTFRYARGGENPSQPPTTRK